MEQVKDQTLYFDSFRHNHRKSIKTMNNTQVIDSKRRHMISKLEAQFMEIPNELRISQLYKLSLENNKLAHHINKVIQIIQENWLKGNKQNIFLNILGNVLCDGLADSDIHLISKVVRENIQPDFEDHKFVKHASFFFNKIFKWHMDMTCENQDDEQILNQKVFLPIIKYLLFFPLCDQGSQINLLKSIEHIFKAQQSQIQTRHRIKRNISLIYDILDYHKKLISDNRHQKQQQLCLKIYCLAVKGCIEVCQLLNNQTVMKVFEVYLRDNNKKMLNIIIQIFQNVYYVEFDINYSVINDFIKQKLFGLALKQEPIYWITLTYNISQNAHDLLLPFLKQIINNICQICQQNNNTIEILQTSLLILRQLIYLQRNEEDIQFFKYFSSINGFRIIDSIQSKNKNINSSIEDILLYQNVRIQEQKNQPFERNSFLALTPD